MTVRDLINQLSNLPDEMEVVVEDADTGWYLSNPQIFEGTKYIIIRSEYTNKVKYE